MGGSLRARWRETATVRGRTRRARQVRAELAAGNPAAAAKVVELLHPADTAELVRLLEEEEVLGLLGVMEPSVASAVLVEMDPEDKARAVEGLARPRLLTLLHEMSPDDAADTVQVFPQEEAEELVLSLPRDEAEDVGDLIRHGEETAGGIMTPGAFFLGQDVTVEEAIGKLRETTDVENISYLYVVDDHEHLVGVLSLRQLITAKDGSILGDVMDKDVFKTSLEVDQEEVAEQVKKYDLRALPVVDGEGRLVGRVTADDVMDVIAEEATEDILRMAGTDGEELSRRSPFGVARLRLPWLLTCLVGGVISATIMKRFSAEIVDVLQVFFFVPVIMGMGGNVGIQSSTIVVRGIATGRVDPCRVRRVLVRELSTGAFMGAVCGIAVGVAARLMGGRPALGLVVASAMFCAITVAAVTGALLPLAFKKANIDPAVATGPFVTTVNDITGLLIYFSLATVLLGHLVT